MYSNQSLGHWKGYHTSTYVSECSTKCVLCSCWSLVAVKRIVHTGRVQRAEKRQKQRGGRLNGVARGSKVGAQQDALPAQNFCTKLMPSELQKRMLLPPISLLIWFWKSHWIIWQVSLRKKIHAVGFHGRFPVTKVRHRALQKVGCALSTGISKENHVHATRAIHCVEKY